MSIARIVADQSYCERNKVGAVLVKDGNIIAFGYNGTPSGFDNCCEIDGVTKPEVLHAEMNAIAKCARSSSNAAGSTLFITLSPCIECAKLIIQAGIESVIFAELYRDRQGIDLLIKAKVKVGHVMEVSKL